MASGQHGTVSGEECARVKVVVTGASGFIGSHLLPVLVSRGHEVVAASRSAVDKPGVAWQRAPELGPEADWSPALRGAEAVIHLAGRAQIGPASPSEETLCSRINAEGTAHLARQAAGCGVRHFLLLSSVHAVAAESDEIVSAATRPRPVSAYGRSKLAAEESVRTELAARGCEWTVWRAPAVYGPGNVAYFGRLLRLVTAGIPLPLASVANRRSFVYVGNLVDALAAGLGNPNAFGKIFLPSDGEGVSTPDLIRAMARAKAGVGERTGSHEQVAGHGLRVAGQAQLFPFPPKIIEAMTLLPGLGALRKLTASLYVDYEALRRELGWTPPFTMGEGLRRTLVENPNAPQA